MMLFKNNKKLEASIEHKPPPFGHHDVTPVPLPPTLGMLLGVIVGVIVLKKVFK